MHLLLAFFIIDLNVHIYNSHTITEDIYFCQSKCHRQFMPAEIESIMQINIMHCNTERTSKFQKGRQ